MNLPSQPEGSDIEIVSEDDPLTLEWPSQVKPPWFGWAEVLAMTLAGAFSILATLGGLRGLLKSLPASVLQVALKFPNGCLFASSVLCLLLFITSYDWLVGWMLRRFGPDPGQARLVLRNDAIIWVAGGGKIPQVYARAEILDSSFDLKGGCFIDVEEDGKRSRIWLYRNYVRPQLEWLAEILKRWMTETA